MNHRIDQLLRNNQAFVETQLRLDPGYFTQLAMGQHPEFLWIGCSDSRVPPNHITGTDPGDMFVHRNIANLVVQTDMNMLSVLQYAVEVLHVRHIIVCGHHGCGGVKAAMGEHSHGLIDNWLRTVKDTQQFYWRELSALDEDARFDRMVELNVIEQVNSLGKTSIVQNAWNSGAALALHGWVFDLHSGRILPQTGSIESSAAMQEICKFANGLVGH
ncbi:MAG: carbonic anhydrase [Burkholderiales bacterium]|jgi:carbonic anhydrase|nr:carbonic anhydrase [Burkholderiales bacterium]